MATKNQYPSQLHDTVNQNFRFTTAHSTSIQTVMTIASGQENETHIHNMIINNKEATARTVLFFINDGTDDVYIGSSGAVPAAVGAAHGKIDVIQQTINLIDRVLVDLKGNKYLRLLPGDVLKALVSVAVTTNNNVFINITGSNFNR